MSKNSENHDRSLKLLLEAKFALLINHCENTVYAILCNFIIVMRHAYTNTKAINGQPTALQKLCWLLFCLVVIGLASAAVYSVINNKVSLPSAAPIEELLPYGTLKELSDPKTFMAAYLSVNCNSDLFRRTQSIRVTGTVESGGLSENFTLIKKRPDKMRFTVKQGLKEITFGANAQVVWRCIRSLQQQEDNYVRIEGDEALKWRKQTRFFDLIISASQGEGKILEIEGGQWAGNDSLKVRLIDTYGDTYEIFIDPNTLYPLAERQFRPDGKMSETIFNDYRDVDGLPTPFQLTVSQENNIVSKIQINSAAINPGLLSKLFELPNALQ